ncbi:hypothetical protein Ddye_019907 [Dipteronia dyeriana]|uniref:Uncharacterized protein n=1 Tax=Dipteronia dyeriana TaxID=168575 RepID=A0AAD9TZ99_9ROSI|nr:hypothetical protein Ddye_019907 [Dipteronia dyeriana]
MFFPSFDQIADHPLPKEASCHRKLLSSVAVAVAESSSPSPGRRHRSCLQFSSSPVREIGPLQSISVKLERFLLWA